MITKEEIEIALPQSLKNNATQGLADKVNALAGDPLMAQVFRDNFISYSGVLKEGRFKTEDYMYAVAYVSLKIMGATNQDSWAKVFPKKYNTLVARGADAKEISAYVAGYNKGKLVNMILEQTLVPDWIINHQSRQMAINKAVELMQHANSEKVQIEAANAILTHVKRPDNIKVEMDLGIKEPEGMSELKTMMTNMAQRQQELIAQGVPTRTIAHQKLGQDLVIDAEVIKES